MRAPLRIFHVSTWERMGGAERVAANLFRAMGGRGHEARLIVGRKTSDDAGVIELPNAAGRGIWYRAWHAAGGMLGNEQPDQPPAGRLARKAWRVARWIAEPGRFADWMRGSEDFRFPGTRRLLDLDGGPPDIVHCHNLHGGYFDLRLLPSLSERVPVVLTLHDSWLLSGHCAYSLDCQRWMTGCGSCPDLSLYPALRRDRTAANWRRKREIYSRCRLHVAAPSQWLLNQVNRSMLAPAVVESRVIPYGVDLDLFRPGDRNAARKALGLPQDARILLFAANGVRRNPYKDWGTLRNAVARAAADWPGGKMLFVALGDDAPPEQVGAAQVRFIPYQADPDAVACYYQAADVYVHAAKADNFPNAVLEALACGTPVVATAVGGIPEQVRSLGGVVRGDAPHNLAAYSESEATGVLVGAGDSQAMAEAFVRLLSDQSLRQRLAGNAAADARLRFDPARECGAYLDWYNDILQRRRGSSSPAASHSGARRS